MAPYIRRSRHMYGIIPILALMLLVFRFDLAAAADPNEPPYSQGDSTFSTEVTRFGTYELGEGHPTLPLSARLTFAAEGGAAKIFVWQGEGHAWDLGCTPGIDQQLPCDNDQLHETARFVLNGVEVGRFIDHSPENDTNYAYEFAVTLAQGENELVIEHTREGGSVNSVFIKGIIFAQAAAPDASCEETTFVVRGRAVNSCGADRPALEITQLYQPSFVGAGRQDGLPRDRVGDIVAIDSTHWVDAVVPAIAGWSRDSIISALEARAQADGRPAAYYLQHPEQVTWALIMTLFGSDRIEGYYVHIADTDDNCGALDGNQGGSDAQRAARWRFLKSAAQYEPLCDLLLTPAPVLIATALPDGVTATALPDGVTATALPTDPSEAQPRGTPIATPLQGELVAPTPVVSAKDRELPPSARSRETGIPAQLPETGGAPDAAWLVFIGVAAIVGGMVLRQLRKAATPPRV